jgi:stalled ribosome rescue protein Dom34
MSAAVIWLTHTEAKIFRLLPGAMPQAEKLESKPKAHGANKQHDAEVFFQEVAKRLEGVKEVLLIGPGTAKQEFRHHLDKHHHQKLSQAVVGLENADHPTEPQILAMARQFFKTYDLYNGA